MELTWKKRCNHLVALEMTEICLQKGILRKILRFWWTFLKKMQFQWEEPRRVSKLLVYLHSEKYQLMSDDIQIQIDTMNEMLHEFVFPKFIYQFDIK